MSTSLNKAIYRRLTGLEGLTGAGLAAQQALANLLAVHPRKGEPAVIQGNKSSAVVYPCITFRPSGGRRPVEAVDIGVRADVFYSFEYWENMKMAQMISDIDAQVERLLDMCFRVVPVLPLESGKCFWMEGMGEIIPGYDGNYNGYYGLRQFKFVEARV